MLSAETTRVWIVSIGLWVSALPLSAQVQPVPNLDTTYVRDLTQYLTPRVLGVLKRQNFGATITGRPYKAVQYLPNLGVGFGIGAFYHWYGLSITFRNPVNQAQEKERGKSKAIDLQANFYGRKVGVDVYLQRYQGFYVNNSGAVYPDKPATTPYIIRPDLISYSAGLNFYYVFNHRKFSYRAANIQTEQQLRSAGSFLVLPSFSFYSVKGDSGLVPSTPSSPPEYSLQKGNFYSLGIAPGYTHTFVFFKYAFLNLSLAPGAALSYLRYDGDLLNFEKRWRLGLRVNARAAVGWNGPKWYGGLSAVGDDYNLLISSNYSFTYLIYNFRLFVGRRFAVRGLNLP